MLYSDKLLMSLMSALTQGITTVVLDLNVFLWFVRVVLRW